LPARRAYFCETARQRCELKELTCNPPFEIRAPVLGTYNPVEQGQVQLGQLSNRYIVILCLIRYVSLFPAWSSFFSFRAARSSRDNFTRDRSATRSRLIAHFVGKSRSRRRTDHRNAALRGNVEDPSLVVAISDANRR